MSDETEDWNRHKERVFLELQMLRDDLAKERDRNHALKNSVNQKLLELNIELAKLQMKSGMWGAASGILGALCVYMLRK